MKYFIRLDSLEKSSLLSQAFEDSKSLHENGKKSWYGSVLDILNELDIEVENINVQNIKLNKAPGIDQL